MPSKSNKIIISDRENNEFVKLLNTCPYFIRDALLQESPYLLVVCPWDLGYC